MWSKVRVLLLEQSDQGPHYTVMAFVVIGALKAFVVVYLRLFKWMHSFDRKWTVY